MTYNEVHHSASAFWPAGLTACHVSSSSYSSRHRSLSKETPAQGFDLCLCITLPSHHPGIGSLSELRGQTTATSQGRGHI